MAWLDCIGKIHARQSEIYAIILARFDCKCTFALCEATMKQWKRLIFYLFLNVLVSACTILAVLFAWDQLRGPLPRGLLPQALRVSSPATATLLPVQTGTPAISPKVTSTEAFTVYQVQSGDTFESIAQQNNMSVEELVAVNGFKKSQPLGEGEILRIPVHPQGSVSIDSIVGVGDLTSERVLLKHNGDGELSLAGWRLENTGGSAFILPQVTLFKGGAVNVYTKTGVNTVVELYWGLDKAVWKSGDQATLRDAQGNVRSTYKVP
jgi:LysM repeat protein